MRLCPEPETSLSLDSFYEMLRLHSSVLGVRTAEQPLSLPTRSGARFEVPKGDVLVIANMCALTGPHYIR